MTNFSLKVLPVLFAVITVSVLAILFEHLFGDAAKYLIVCPALVIGMNSRRIVEKIIGTSKGDLK